MARVVHGGALYLTLTIWDAPSLGARSRRIIRSVIGRCVGRACQNLFAARRLLPLLQLIMGAFYCRKVWLST
jgi:hypothetical protein